MNVLKVFKVLLFCFALLRKVLWQRKEAVSGVGIGSV